ncbi:MAG: hypothetical protein ACI4BD_02040 [Paludibacteraceae bacterium]
MKAFRALILFFSLLCTVALQGEILVLQSGKEIQGTIVFQNEEVVIIKTSSGNRFQYPASDVKTIRTERTNSGDTDDSLNAQCPPEQAESSETRKKVSVAVELAGGAASWSRDNASYGNMAADLLIGSHNLLNRGIFLGGSVGYTGALYSTTKIIQTTTSAITKKTVEAYNFLPIAFAARIPLLQQKHAPMIGMQVGYGVALSKDYKGGLYAGLNIGYCYRISDRQRLYIAADCRFQQAFLSVSEQITDTEGMTHDYTQQAGRCAICYGVRLGIYL